MTTLAPTQNIIAELRNYCQGVLPLDATLKPWMIDLFSIERDELFAAVEQFGSPLNMLCSAPFVENLKQLQKVADDRQLPFKIFFARKANKCLTFVDAANKAGAGIDVASLQECRQALARNVSGENIICTAAIKTQELIEMCVQHGVTIAVDNRDEWECIRATASNRGLTTNIALRVSGFTHHESKLHSRFGFDIGEVVSFTEDNLQQGTPPTFVLKGLHFHLDGYCSDQRVSAIDQSLQLIDALRGLGHPVEFLDIGGGLPMSYLTSAEQWNAFLHAHEQALCGRRSPITYRNHGLGLIAKDDHLYGERNVYPYFQTIDCGSWLAKILEAKTTSAETIANAMRRRKLRMHCEPGRSLLNGCGVTIARVEFTKQHHTGDWFIGLAMNRTQCRTGSDDFLVDPIVVSDHQEKQAKHGQEKQGYLVGAYCTESELISLRRLRFPEGISAGDLVAFPNTAGYFMHFLESRSHQFPLANNVVRSNENEEPWRLDDIETVPS